MLEEEETPISAEEVEPPVFDDGSDYEESDNEDETSDVVETYRPEDPPRVKRGRPRKKHYKTPGYIPVPQGKNRQEILPWEDRNLEWDGWCNSFDWEKDATLKFILKRLTPDRAPNGQMISGVLETRQGSPALTEEIRATYGGGTYEAIVTGLHPLVKDNKPRVLARRRLPLPGQPNFMDSALPRSVLSARGGSASDPIARTAMDMVKSELENLRRGQSDNPRLVERTIATMKEVSEQRAKFAETSAEARIALINKQLEETRNENKNLSDRLRTTESEMTKRTIESQDKLSRAVRETQDNSMSILTQLLPTLSGNASEQVKQMTLMYQSREERQAAEYKMMLQQMQSNFQSQMEARQHLFLAQLESSKSQYENTIALLQHELQISRAEVVSLQKRIDELRATLDTKTQELIGHSKPKSAIEQIAELGSVMDVVDGLRGRFGAGEPDEDKSPWDKAMAMLPKVVENLPAIIQARQQVPQMIPQQVVMPQTRSLPPPAIVPRPTPQPIQSQPAPTAPKVRKEDVSKALKFIENVMNTGGESPPDPDAVAMTAISQADNTVLKALSSRNPENVISQLQEQKMLSGVLLEDKGKKYLISILTALKKRLG